MDEVEVRQTFSLDIEEIVMDGRGDELARGKPKAGAGSSTRQKWQVPVDVYLDSVDPLLFHIESPIQPAPDTDLVFHNNCHPGFEIVFNFHDETADPDGYSFVKPKEDAIWSQMGDGPDFCPKAAVAPGLTVLKPKRLSEDAMTLVVTNENVEPFVGHFQYTLRVTNGKQPPILLDPGGINMNGGTSRD